MAETTIRNTAQMQLACDRFCLYFREDATQFWPFIGAPFEARMGQSKYLVDSDTWKLPLDVARKVDLLNSPHYYTILRAMEVRK